MYLRSLDLTNFRNFRRLSLELDNGLTIIQADNGEGKTNLLEAIELLATAKSPRAGSDRELIHWAALEGGAAALEPFARIRAVVAHERREIRADVLVRAANRGAAGEGVSKSFRINGVGRRALEFIGAINAVSFSPLDVGLVSGPPSGRRRYLDIMNSQASPRYLYSLQRYGKLLLQRNQLLRHLRERGPDVDRSDLPAWTNQLAHAGAFVIEERTRSVGDLGRLADEWFHRLGGKGDELEVQYRPSLGEHLGTVLRPNAADMEAAVADVHACYAEALARMEAREMGAGMTLVGPHRDDVRFCVDGIDLTVYGSRGQQRLVALALKLAEADLLEQRVQSRPILLMDDVLSELDRPRQAAILGFVRSAGQSLLSVTSLSVVDWSLVPGASVLRLENGGATWVEGSLPTTPGEDQ